MPLVRVREKRSLTAELVGMRSRSQRITRKAGVVIAGVMRNDIGRQFSQQRGYTRPGYGAGRPVPWRRSKPFGTKPAPRKTLHGRGHLRSAWQGGSGSTLRIRRNRVAVGVDTTMFPQAGVFQSRTLTLIRVTQKMRAFLGMKYDVWLKKSRTFIVVHPRPVGASPDMLRRVGKVFARYVETGKVSR